MAKLKPLRVRHWTPERLRGLHPAVLRIVHEQLKLAALQIANMQMWALDELVRRGHASTCHVCGNAIDPGHARRFDPEGERHRTCARPSSAELVDGANVQPR